jgi:hypothetical protein
VFTLPPVFAPLSTICVNVAVTCSDCWILAGVGICHLIDECCNIIRCNTGSLR